MIQSIEFARCSLIADKDRPIIHAIAKANILIAGIRKNKLLVPVVLIQLVALLKLRLG